MRVESGRTAVDPTAWPPLHSRARACPEHPHRVRREARQRRGSSRQARGWRRQGGNSDAIFGSRGGSAPRRHVTSV